MHEIHNVAQQSQKAKCTIDTWDPVFTSSVDQAVDGGACPGYAARSLAGGEREALGGVIDLAEACQIPHILVVPDLLDNHSRIEAFITQADQICCSSAEAPADSARSSSITCDPWMGAR